MENQTRFALKRPVIIQLLGIGFLLAGPFNLAFALLQTEQGAWWDPRMWASLFQHLPLQEQLLLTLLPISGALLYVQRKTSWFFALATMFTLSAYNIYVIFSGEETLMAGVTLTGINAVIITIFYFFRFPYLDQRDHLFKGISTRYVVRYPTVGFWTEDGKNLQSQFLVTNLSESGCFLVAQNGALPRVGLNLQIKLAEVNISCRLVHTRQDGFGVAFDDPSVISDKLVKQIIEASKTGSSTPKVA